MGVCQGVFLLFYQPFALVVITASLFKTLLIKAWVVLLKLSASKLH